MRSAHSVESWTSECTHGAELRTELTNAQRYKTQLHNSEVVPLKNILWAFTLLVLVLVACAYSYSSRSPTDLLLGVTLSGVEFASDKVCHSIRATDLVIAITTHPDSVEYRQFLRYLIRPSILQTAFIFFVAGNVNSTSTELLRSEARLYEDMVIGTYQAILPQSTHSGMATAMRVISRCSEPNRDQVFINIAETVQLNYSYLNLLGQSRKLSDHIGNLTGTTVGLHHEFEQITSLKRPLFISKWPDPAFPEFDAFMMFTDDVSLLARYALKYLALCGSKDDKSCVEGRLNFPHVLGLAARLSGIQIIESPELRSAASGGNELCTNNNSDNRDEWTCKCDPNGWILSCASADAKESDHSRHALLMRQCPNLFNSRHSPGLDASPINPTFNYEETSCSHLREHVLIVQSAATDKVIRQKWRKQVETDDPNWSLIFVVSTTPSKATHSEIQAEFDEYRDMILGQFSDSSRYAHGYIVGTILLWADMCFAQSLRARWLIRADPTSVLNLDLIQARLAHIRDDGIVVNRVKRSDIHRSLSKGQKSNAIEREQVTLKYEEYPILITGSNLQRSMAPSENFAELRPIAVPEEFHILSRMSINRLASQLRLRHLFDYEDPSDLMGLLLQDVNFNRRRQFIDNSRIGHVAINGSELWVNNPELPDSMILSDGVYINSLTRTNLTLLDPHESPICAATADGDIEEESCDCHRTMAVSASHAELIQTCEVNQPHPTNFDFSSYLIVDDVIKHPILNSRRVSFDLIGALQLWADRI